jgi:SOS-response transcriptional repressor LexA
MKKTNTHYESLKRTFRDLKEEELELISLDEYVANGKSDIYYIRIIGNATADLDVFDGDLLVVDRQRMPKDGNLVISQIGDDVLIHAYKRLKGDIYLATSNGEKVVQSKHKPVFVPKSKESIVWAIVTHIVRNVENKGKHNAQN